MMKYKKGEIPPGYNLSDFECFGPIASKDGEFDNMLCELGCFTQDGRDTNKFYCGAVVKANETWFAYFEWGRVGGRTDFQFHQFISKSDAQLFYKKQLHKKNDKRGEWFDHPQLGRILRAKKGKDCYLVRDQAVLSISLPDAKKLKKAKVKVSGFDRHSESLLSDLQTGTISYTKTQLVNNAIPSEDSIKQGRELIKLALNSKSEKEIEEYTNILYSKIPKVKSRGQDYLLSKENAKSWSDDLDAFENALTCEEIKPDFEIEYVCVKTELGKYIVNWFESATRNKHHYMGNARIKGIWKVNIPNKFEDRLEKIQAKGDRPLHQPNRIDIDSQEKYTSSNVGLLFHGTRSVNVGGILNGGFRNPKELSGVSINGALFGGNGTYFADDYKKSVNYCSTTSGLYTRGSGLVSGRHSFIFLCDVILGKTYTPKYMEKRLPSGYNSFYAKSGVSGVQNNEFIVFDTNQIKIRYLIEFTI